MASLSLSLCRGLLIPISRCISVSDKADMMAPDLTLALQAATYLNTIRFIARLGSGGNILSAHQAGIPTQSSSQATMVGPFHRAKGVPAFMASSRSS